MSQTEREDLPFDPALDPARDPDNETPDQTNEPDLGERGPEDK